MNYKKYWDNKQDLTNHLRMVEEIKNSDFFAWKMLNITAKVYKELWGIPLNEARVLALSLR